MIFRRFDINSVNEIYEYLNRFPNFSSDFSLGYLFMRQGRTGLHVWSRRYKENRPSREMIETSGITPDREDDTFYYFK